MCPLFDVPASHRLAVRAAGRIRLPIAGLAARIARACLGRLGALSWLARRVQLTRLAWLGRLARPTVLGRQARLGRPGGPSLACPSTTLIWHNKGGPFSECPTLRATTYTRDKLESSKRGAGFTPPLGIDYARFASGRPAKCGYIRNTFCRFAVVEAVCVVIATMPLVWFEAETCATAAMS